MSVAKKSIASKALQSFMAKAKKYDTQIALEWEMAFNTNGTRANRKVWDQSEINKLYSREWSDGECGATKVCHTVCHNGHDFGYIVVKRFQYDGWGFDSEGSGNQLIDEIRCWERYASTDDSDYLCPILKYFTSKSDKVASNSETMKNNVVIIAQKAEYVSDLRDCCREAAKRNGESDWRARYDEMCNFSKRNGWRDAIGNPGNSGVIFDHNTNEYKAVFIDYAL